MPITRCPRVNELQAMAMSRPVSTRIRRHVEACDVCTNALAALREDAEFTQLLREAARTELDEETRAHVLEICERAIENAKRAAGAQR